MKKILALVLAITTVFALAVPAMAKEKETVLAPTAEFDGNNANFHCNDIEGENGRVWPDLSAYGVTDGKGNGNGNNKDKMAGKFHVTRVGNTTTWTLDETVVCPDPECKRTDWVTFSNNSGVPNGNNVQFQHPFSTRRWITLNIEVIYNLTVPECKVTCRNSKAVCKFNCAGCVCPNENKTHTCTLECYAKGHDCKVANVVLCAPVCGCAKFVSESIVKLVDVKKLIKIADGYTFEHEVPYRWKEGKYVSGAKLINKKLMIRETFYTSVRKTYYVDYEGRGTCKCKCKLVKCNVACKPCDWTPPQPHEHVAVCDNCKSGKGGNHENCERANPENNTNYFCLICGDKVGSWNGNKGWEPDGKPIVCACPVCYGP